MRVFHHLFFLCIDVCDELFPEYHKCENDQFQCASGHCISNKTLCDGRRNCEDMSDEKNCNPRFPGGRFCPASKFECANTVRFRT